MSLFERRLSQKGRRNRKFENETTPISLCTERVDRSTLSHMRAKKSKKNPCKRFPSTTRFWGNNSLFMPKKNKKVKKQRSKHGHQANLILPGDLCSNKREFLASMTGQKSLFHFVSPQGAFGVSRSAWASIPLVGDQAKSYAVFQKLRWFPDKYSIEHVSTSIQESLRASWGPMA